MSPRTPPRGRCYTPTAIHQVSARQRPARTPALPTAASTEPDDLLPARIESRAAGTDDALRGTRLDGARYESFVRKLAEEVVLQVGDPRVDPPARTRKM